MIVLFVILWIVAAFICAGYLMHTDPNEWAHNDESRMVAVLFSLVTWWVLLAIKIGALVLKVLIIIPTFISGVLDAMKKEKEAKDE